MPSEDLLAFAGLCRLEASTASMQQAFFTSSVNPGETLQKPQQLFLSQSKMLHNVGLMFM